MNKLSRIPRRIVEDIRIIGLASNWPAILSAKLKRKKISRIRLRNGIDLQAPDEVDLNFLFHEIWIDRIYNPSGYAVNAGDRVIDIGGNIGIFAIFAATRARDIKVFSFEPFPSNVKVFGENILRNKLGSISLYEKAVSDTITTRNLQVSDSWVSHSLVGENNPSHRSVEVAVTTLSEIMLSVGKCDLLKIDCEGSEYEIFYSTDKETLNNIHRIVCEYHNNKHGAGNDLKEFFEKNGFTIDYFKKFDESTGLICATNHNFS